jgi:hypothetical protein
MNCFAYRANPSAFFAVKVLLLAKLGTMAGGTIMQPRLHVVAAICIQLLEEKS